MSVGADLPEKRDHMRGLISALVLMIPAAELQADTGPRPGNGAGQGFQGGCPAISCRAGPVGGMQTDGPVRQAANDEPKKDSNRDEDAPDPEPPLIRVMIALN